MKFKILIIGICSLFTGCTVCPKPEKEVVTVVETVYINTPVPCIIPEVDCEFKGSNLEPVAKLLQCIIEQKRAMETCSRNSFNKYLDLEDGTLDILPTI